MPYSQPFDKSKGQGFGSPEEFFRERLKNVREEIVLRRKALEKRPVHRGAKLTFEEHLEEDALKNILTEPVEHFLQQICDIGLGY